mgnify:CR=1 FL=1
MKKLIIYYIGISIFVIGNLSAQDNSQGMEKTQAVEVKPADIKEDLAKLPACCINKGDSEKCCNKGQAVATTENVDQPACCKKKGGAGNCCKTGVKKTVWWKFWKK